MRSAPAVLIAFLLMATLGHGPTGPVEGAAAGAILPETPAIPSYSFDWQSVHDATEPVVAEFLQLPWGGCVGHVHTQIHLPPGLGSLTRSLERVPLDDRPCAFTLHAVERVGPERAAEPAADPAEASNGCCAVAARFLGAGGTLHGAAPVPHASAGISQAEAVGHALDAFEERFRQRWIAWHEAHDPTTR